MANRQMLSSQLASLVAAAVAVAVVVAVVVVAAVVVWQLKRQLSQGVQAVDHPLVVGAVLGAMPPVPLGKEWHRSWPGSLVWLRTRQRSHSSYSIHQVMWGLLCVMPH